MGNLTAALLGELANRPNPVVLDRKNKFVFLANNKVAQTSIVRNAWAHRCVVKKDSIPIWHWTKWRTNLRLEKGLPVFSFTIVRNPYEMVVSAYSYLKTKKRSKIDLDFEDFVCTVLAVQGESFDPHFLSQSAMINISGNQTVDRIFHLENLNADWADLCEEIGEKAVSLPHANVSRKDKEWQKFYTDRSIAVVNELYSEDFAVLKYSKL